jgi:hypothetical protein
LKSRTGFSRIRALAAMGRPEARARYAELAQLVISGQLMSEVAAVYPLEEVRAALRHAGQDGRDGKVVLRYDSLALFWSTARTGFSIGVRRNCGPIDGVGMPSGATSA